MTKKELEGILAEVEAEIGSLLKSQTEELKKTVGEEAPPVKEESSGSASPAPEASSASPAPEASASASGEASSASPGSEPAESSAPVPGEVQEAAPEQEAQGPVTVEELASEYAKLAPEDLKTHLMAAQMAAKQLMQSQAPQAPEAPAAPPAPPAPEAPPAPVPPEQAMKSEMSAEMSKSEDLQKQLEQQKVQLEALTKALVTVLEKPIRKAATGPSSVSVVEKPTSAPEEMPKFSKSELTQKLNEKIRSGSLSKSDMKLVTDYYERQIDLSKLSHLLK